MLFYNNVCVRNIKQKKNQNIGNVKEKNGNKKKKSFISYLYDERRIILMDLKWLRQEYKKK